MSAAYARDTLAEAATAGRVIPATVHAQNCAKVRALLTGRPDALELADILGLDATPPQPVKARAGEHHYHGTLVPPVHRVGAMA